MNRRDFSRLGLGVSLVGAAGWQALAETFDYPWKLGVITDEVAPDLHEVLTNFYPKYELRWAEIRHLKLDGTSKYVYRRATPAELQDTKKLLDDANVKLSVLDTGVYKIALPGTTPIGASAAT